MKKVYAILLLFCFVLGSCARGISPYDAANGKAKCGKYLK